MPRKKRERRKKVKAKPSPAPRGRAPAPKGKTNANRKKTLGSVRAKPERKLPVSHGNGHKQKGRASKSKKVSPVRRKKVYPSKLPSRIKSPKKPQKGSKGVQKGKARSAGASRPSKRLSGSATRKKSAVKRSSKAKQPLRKKKPSLRVIKERARPVGITGNKGRKPKKLSRKDLDRERKRLAREESRARRKIQSIREKLRANERALSLSQSKRGEIIERLRAAKEWLDSLADRAKSLGHRTRIAQALNQDGTSDLQLSVYDWPSGKGLYQSITDFIIDLGETMPNLGKGIKIRAQVHISGDRIEKEKGKKRYAYLPSVLGRKAVYFNYVRPASFGTLLFTMRDSVTEKLQDDGWRTVAICLDLRFDPRYMIERERK